ncbi:hypothetical protein ABGB18_47225 [Nonomuraea sp. B12E4]|uniref:hypothetical protein n=1 Tax=Nonomuraea sp. B12E4 TaxID=3153564 RepID=UPI00325E0D6E
MIDFEADPVPHVDEAAGMARLLPADRHSVVQAESWALTERLIDGLWSPAHALV